MLKYENWVLFPHLHILISNSWLSQLMALDNVLIFNIWGIIISFSETFKSVTWAPSPFCTDHSVWSIFPPVRQQYERSLDVISLHMQSCRSLVAGLDAGLTRNGAGQGFSEHCFWHLIILEKFYYPISFKTAHIYFVRHFLHIKEGIKA